MFFLFEGMLCGTPATLLAVASTEARRIRYMHLWASQGHSRKKAELFFIYSVVHDDA